MASSKQIACPLRCGKPLRNDPELSHAWHSNRSVTGQVDVMAWATSAKPQNVRQVGDLGTGMVPEPSHLPKPRHDA